MIVECPRCGAELEVTLLADSRPLQIVGGDHVVIVRAELVDEHTCIDPPGGGERISA